VTTDESKKLDNLSEKMDELNKYMKKVLYQEPGIVHEVKDLCDWRKTVSTNLTWLGRILIGLLIAQTTAAIIYSWKNSN